MSLINKMLQDLDARGGQSASPLEGMPRPVPMPERRGSRPLLMLAALAAGLMVLGGGGYAGWRYLKRPSTAPAASVQIQTAPPRVRPAANSVQEPVETSAKDVAKAVQPAPVQSKPALPPAPAKPVPTSAAHTTAAPPAARAVPVVAPEARAAVSKAASAEKPAARKKNATASTPAATDESAQGREMTPQQKAESLYSRANAAQQEGRVSEAVSLLEQALQTDPRHDAARQMLVSLLVEAHRSVEAMRVLQIGLTLDPRQPNMAMLLARLQIENGGTGIDTLMRTLPYAAGNADYHAFLAGALQRAQRQREAIEQYQAALRSAPGNGVWLMGLGISLQAEKRNAEAADAYSRALATGSLSPQLQEFVARRLDQIKR